MSGASPNASVEAPVEAAVEAHACLVVAGDPAAALDLAPTAALDPPDLFVRLAGLSFRAFEMVAHAKIGAHHVFKTKYLGPTTVVVQGRWAVGAAGRWQLREAEIVRITADGPA